MKLALPSLVAFRAVEPLGASARGPNERAHEDDDAGGAGSTSVASLLTRSASAVLVYEAPRRRRKYSTSWMSGRSTLGEDSTA